MTRFSRILLVWLLSVGIAIVVGIASAAAVAVIAIPLFIAGIAATFAGSAAVAVVIMLSVLILLPILLVVGGFLAAQSSTYWTLAFRRLEIEAAPAAYPLAYPPPSPAAP
jgi:hypothetical protein